MDNDLRTRADAAWREIEADRQSWATEIARRRAAVLQHRLANYLCVIVEVAPAHQPQVTVEDITFVLVEDGSRDYLAITQPCPFCEAPMFSLSIGDMKELALALAGERWRHHKCAGQQIAVAVEQAVDVDVEAMGWS